MSSSKDVPNLLTILSERQAESKILWEISTKFNLPSKNKNIASDSLPQKTSILVLLNCHPKTVSKSIKLKINQY